MSARASRRPLRSDEPAESSSRPSRRARDRVTGGRDFLRSWRGASASVSSLVSMRSLSFRERPEAPPVPAAAAGVVLADLPVLAELGPDASVRDLEGG